MPSSDRRHAESVAAQLEPLIARMLPKGKLRIGIRCWDGSRIGPDDASATLVIASPDALRRILWSPGELGLGRAYVAGDLDVEGDIYQALDLRALIGDAHEHVEAKLDAKALPGALKVARKIGAIGKPLPPPKEEAHLKGRRHSKQRDAAAIAHHYDVGNDFYRLVLGPTMAYSCAFWAGDDFTLEDAQEAKFELICRKLGLRPGMRLLDVGCGWGGLVMHAARHHGVTAVGVTVAGEQQRLAAQRVRDAGLSDQVEIRYQDYREVDDGPFDAVSSVGMFEHVGVERMKVYFSHLKQLLRPGGRLLNHAISSPDTRGGRVPSRSFIGRYVFPDGELLEVGTVITAMQDLGFEVRDVESLREHYAKTLRAWVTNLESDWDRAVALAGSGRARVWRLYMAASAVNFEANRTAIHQVLAVNTPENGNSGIPATRTWLDVRDRTNA